MMLIISSLYRGGGGDFVLPNVSYVKDSHHVYYNPLLIDRGPMLKCTFNATPDNLVAFINASNIKSLKVNGTPIEFEPIKNENTAFDVLGENISLDMGTGAATFPDSYLIKSPVTSWSFKAKDPNYTINENTYFCILVMMDGMTMAQPQPIAEAMGYAFTTNDGVTLEVTDTFLAEMNMGIQSGMQVGFTLMDVDMNSGTFAFIDTEHQTNVTTGGLSTYSFDSEGLYDVEIELSDSDMKDIQFNEVSLISIEIGDGITSICEYTFEDCINLTSVIIGSDVTEIGDFAFRGCSGLISIVIPYGVTSIGNNAFQNCSKLTSIVIPDSVTSIGSYAFAGCTSLPLINDIRYADTYLVEATDKTLATYKIKEGTKFIGDNAFKSCSGLASITIPNSVTSIGISAFTYCTSLTSITIGNSVTSIGNEAFKGCSGLTGELVIPDSVKTIGSYAFQNCKGLTGELVIPNSVTSIGGLAFSYCTGLTSVVIPDSVTSIGVAVFQNCSGLTGELVIPDSVKTIGDNAFFNCSKLTSVTIPDSVTSIGNGAFQECSGLTSITIPDSVKTIGSEAFQKCSGLSEIICKGNIAPQIQNNTFGNQYGNIKKYGVLTVPDNADYSSWMSTDKYYLGYYGWLYSNTPVYDLVCTYNADNTTNYIKLYNSSSTDFKPFMMIINGEKLDASSTYRFNEIGQNEVIYRFLTPITEIKTEIFKDCKGLTSINIPDSVNTIGASAFKNCLGLTSIVVSPGNTVYDSRENCNCIIETATNTLIIGCKNSFIPDSVTSIGEWAFYGCSGLTGELVIPDSVTEIGGYAFLNCSGLTGELVIPDSVTIIRYDAFFGCKGLTDLTIGTGVTSIGASAFQKCSGLTGELVIPDSVTSIGQSAFYGCSGLTSVEIGSGCTSISNYAFQKCSGLTGELVIPDSVTSIGVDAFEDCTGLTDLTIGTGVTIISAAAFKNCSGLTGELVIPDSVNTIGASAFQDCRDLTSVTIGSGVTYFGADTFSGCSGLTSITCLAPTALSILTDTFYNVPTGGTLYVPAGSDYSSWMSTSSYYLGYYNWTIQYI